MICSSHSRICWNKEIPQDFANAELAMLAAIRCTQHKQLMTFRVTLLFLLFFFFFRSPSFKSDKELETMICFGNNNFGKLHISMKTVTDFICFSATTQHLFFFFVDFKWGLMQKKKMGVPTLNFINDRVIKMFLATFFIACFCNILSCISKV